MNMSMSMKTKKDNKALEIFIFGVVLVSIVFSFTSPDKRVDIKLDDLPANRAQTQNPPFWSSEAQIGSASTSDVTFDQINPLINLEDPYG